MSPNLDNQTEGSGDEGDLASHRTIRGGGWSTRLIAFFLSALLCVVAAEVTARAFWRLWYGVPFLHPDRILYAYYPELRRVDTERPTHGDEFYDILLLGASTLNRDWGRVEQELLEQLADHGHRNVRIFNLAQAAHTSRDSWLKYAALGEARFGLVVVYDGINEARANNAPPEIFREDYSHYSWYQIVNALAPYHGTAYFALPYTLRYLAINMQYVLAKDRYVPTHCPRQDWVRYGRESRSAVSFKHNLGAILDLAARRGDRVLLMTFATYVPEDYVPDHSLEICKAKNFDPASRLIIPLEIWGAREDVLKTVAIQNEIIRGFAAEHEGVLFVDQAHLMPGARQYFNDPCHFTAVGSAKFVESLLVGLLPSLKSG